MNLFAPSHAPLSVTVLVLPGSSMMTVASVLDPMRACNRISGDERIVWRAVSADGAPVELSCGLPLAVHGALGAAAVGDLLLIVAGFDVLRHVDRRLLARLGRVMPRFATVSGIESGAWVLGAAGVLAGRRATTHWEDLEEFAARYLEAEVVADRYVIDGRIVTAGGASPAFDLILHLIRTRFGAAVALDVASVFVYDEAHAGTDAQPLVSLGRLGAREPRVAAAIRLMEASLDRPLASAVIARRVGVSVRTLEALFRRVLGVGPGAYGVQLRLQAARKMVTDTDLPLGEVAVRTGFASHSSFAHSFRRHAGFSAGDLRRRARATRG
jgi:AraC family transcriptional regulator, glycine betaine-responsive activator